MYSYPFQELNNDDYAPTGAKIKLSLQQWVDGGHYTFACIDTSNRTIRNDFDYEYKYYYSSTSLKPLFIGTNAQNYPTSFSEKVKLDKWLSWQSYHTRPIPVDFRALVETYSDIGDVETVYDKDFDEYYLKTTEEHSRGDLTRKITKPNGTIINQRFKNGAWVLTASASNSDRLYFTIHDTIADWLKPVPGYESVWNNPIATSLTISVTNNIVGGAHSTYSTLPSNWANTIPEHRLGRIGTNWWRCFLTGFRRFSINGDIHEVALEAFNSNWLLYRTVFDAPCYLDLVTGYFLDDRQIPQSITLNSAMDKTIRLGYYRRNPFEEVKEKQQKLTSIDWIDYKIELIANESKNIEVDDIVLGTLLISEDVEISTISLGSNFYDIDCLKYDTSLTADLFAQWQGFYDTEIARTQSNYPNYMPRIANGQTHNSSGKLLRILAANNDRYANSIVENDLQPDPNHPLFKIDNQRTYDYFFKPQPDGSFGDLKMDSWRTINILDALQQVSKALDAEKFSTNELDPSSPRITTIGHLVEKIAFLLGYRPDADGKFDKSKEKSRVRQIIPAGKKVDAAKVGVNNFAEDGMVLKRLNNRFKGDKIVADECVVVKDLLQLISEYHDQDNLALGIQESSAIEVNTQHGTARYNNQLEILVDLITIVKESQEMIRSAMVSGLVTQGQTTEIIAGIGLPSVTKTLPVTIDGKNKAIPYKGIAAHRSLSQEVATVAYNVGVVTGQLI
jgi:hypothetical protein